MVLSGIMLIWGFYIESCSPKRALMDCMRITLLPLHGTITLTLLLYPYCDESCWIIFVQNHIYNEIFPSYYPLMISMHSTGSHKRLKVSPLQQSQRYSHNDIKLLVWNERTIKKTVCKLRWLFKLLNHCRWTEVELISVSSLKKKKKKP